MAEEKRLAFVEKRDGVKSAILFAEQGIRQYRKAVIKEGWGLKIFKKQYIESYYAFKKYIRFHKELNEKI